MYSPPRLSESLIVLHSLASATFVYLIKDLLHRLQQYKLANLDSKHRLTLRQRLCDASDCDHCHS
jgi:hypothetical protein